MFTIIQVHCLTKHLQWDASSSTPSHTICHHFKDFYNKIFFGGYSDIWRWLYENGNFKSFGNGKKKLFYWDDFPWMRRGFLCLACVAGRIIWEEAEIATSANDDHLNICFWRFQFFSVNFLHLTWLLLSKYVTIVGWQYITFLLLLNRAVCNFVWVGRSHSYACCLEEWDYTGLVTYSSLLLEHATPCYWPSPDPEILSHRNRNWAGCRVCKKLD